MFAIVDIETTGSYAAANSITEIAVVVSDGLKVINRFDSLVKPDHSIPISIQSLTGIDDNMVADAPSFTEIAGALREILGEHIFVAHNVHFDLSFIQAAFKSEGIDYKPRRLCTVRYSRRIKKGLKSYSLSNLCKHFKLNNEATHRAWGDANVTAKLLHLLLEEDKQGQWQHMIKVNTGELNLPVHLPAKEFHDLPNEPGVYYFYNREGAILYVGKANRLKSRVSSHFTADKSTSRSAAFKREIAHIHYELCGNILQAGLWEDHEIRRLWPPHNRAQKNPKQKFGVFIYPTQSGQSALGINRVNRQQSFLIQFHNLEKARAWVSEKVEQFKLDPKLCGFPQSGSGNNEGHEKGIKALLLELKKGKQQRLILLRGRDKQEQGFLQIGSEGFISMGYFPIGQAFKSLEELVPFIKEVNTSATTEGIIRDGLKRLSYQEVLIQ